MNGDLSWPAIDAALVKDFANFAVPTGGVPRVSPAPAPVPQKGVGDVTSTAKGSAARYNAGKAPLDLIPLRCIADFYKAQLGDRITTDQGEALACMYRLAGWQETGESQQLLLGLIDLGNRWGECARVLEYGKGKYAPWNWAKGFAWSIPFACAARHLRAILDGEKVDTESGETHRGHVYANVVMLLTFQTTYPEGDDRPRTLTKR